MSDGDCDENQMCEDGVCVDVFELECIENVDCLSGQVCKENVCFQCIVDFDCDDGQQCNDGVCQDVFDCMLGMQWVFYKLVSFDLVMESVRG